MTAAAVATQGAGGRCKVDPVVTWRDQPVTRIAAAGARGAPYAAGGRA